MRRQMLLTGALACLVAGGIVIVRGQPTEGLVAYYAFSGDATDLGSNSFHGTVHGATLGPDRKGQPNMAYTFNGTSDYIDLGNSALFRPTDQVTLSLWASADWENITADCALAGNTHSGGYELYILADPGVIQGLVRRSGSYAAVSRSLTGLAPGWHHFALVSDSTNTFLFVDATLMATVAKSGPIQYTYANSFLIGAEASSGATPEDEHFPGSIDEVRIYNRVVSKSEIAVLSEIPDVLPELATESAVLLSWEIVPGNYAVESALAIDGEWTRVAGTVLQVEGRSRLSVAVGASEQYFRLVRAE